MKMQTGWPGRKWAPLITALISYSAAAQTTVEVSIENYKYSPAEVEIHPGDTVRWTNREKRTSHSILFPGEGGLESDRIFPGESYQRTFSRGGTYSYTCGPHPEMKGSVLVQE